MDIGACGVICLIIIENIIKGVFNVEFDESVLVSYRQTLYDLLISKAKN